MTTQTTTYNARYIDDTKGILWGSKYYAREMSHGIGYDACICCGKDTRGTQGVIIIDGGGVIVHPADAHLAEQFDAAGFMGFFPIGPDCIKAIPAEYRANA